MVGVLGRRIEHEVSQLVRNHHPDPGVVNRIRTDIGEQGADIRMRLAANVLARAGPEDVVEGRPIAVHVEVDRIALRHSEKGADGANGVVADLHRPKAEGLTAVHPVDGHELAGHRLPFVPRVVVVDLRRCADYIRPIRQGQAEAGRHVRIRQQESAWRREDPGQRG